MTTTPKSLSGESLNGSWVDVTNDIQRQEQQPSPPPPTQEQTSTLDVQIRTNLREALSKGLKSVERLLQDAARESGQGTPKSMTTGHDHHDVHDCSNSISPVSPCSPSGYGMVGTDGESSPMSVFEAILLNQDDLMERSRQVSTEWLWDWSCRAAADQQIDTFSGNTLKSGQSIKKGGNKDGNNDQLMIFNCHHQQQQQKKQLSLRQWALRNGLFSKEILSIFLFSNVLSLILGAGIGYSVLIKRSL